MSNVRSACCANRFGVRKLGDFWRFRQRTKMGRSHYLRHLLSRTIQSTSRLPSYNDESEVYAAHEYCSLDFVSRNQALDVRTEATGTTVPIGARAGCCNAAGVSSRGGQHPSGCLECQRTDPCAPGRESFGFICWISGWRTVSSIRPVGEEHLR